LFLSTFLLSPKREEGGEKGHAVYKRGRTTFKRPHERIGWSYSEAVVLKEKNRR